MAEQNKPETIREYLYEIKVVYDEKSLDDSLKDITEKFSDFFAKMDAVFKNKKFDMGIPDIKNNKFYDKSAIDAMVEKKRKRDAEKEAEREAERAKKQADRDMMKAINIVRKDTIKVMKESEKESQQKVLNFLSGPKGLLTKSFYGMVAYKSMEVLYKGFKAIEKTTTETSNKLIESNSMFIDKGIRDTMIKYGASSQEAIGMRKSMDILGIADEDMLKLTGGQAKAYRELMVQYSKGLQSIEPEQLDRFNKSIQDYQKTMGSFKMDLQIQKMKFLAENSDTIKTFFDFIGTLVDLASGILKVIRPVVSAAGFVLNLPIKLLTDIGGAIKNNVGGNNITVNQTNNNQVNGGDIYEVQDTITRSNQALIEMVGGNIE